MNNTGWICPRCGKVLAPWMPECNCKAADIGKIENTAPTPNPQVAPCYPMINPFDPTSPFSVPSPYWMRPVTVSGGVVPLTVGDGVIPLTTDKV